MTLPFGGLPPLRSMEEPSSGVIMSPPSTPKKAVALTEDPMEDDRLNGLSPLEGIGGNRLRTVDEENTQFLRNQRWVTEQPAERPREEKDTAEPALYVPDGMPTQPENVEPVPVAAPAPRQRPVAVIRDPMQMTADDILPRPQKATTAPGKAGSAQTTAPHYTRVMENREGEEGLMRETKLLMDLGYESSLRSPEEQRRAEAVHAGNAAGADETAAEPTVGQSTKKKSLSADPTLMMRDTATFFGSFVPLVVALVGALFGLMLDFLPLFLAGSEAAIAFTNSFAYPLVELGCILLVSAIFLLPLGKGFKGLWDFTPTRYSLPAVALTATALHSAVSVFVPADDRAPLFGGAAILMLAVAALAECLRTSADGYARSVATSGKDVYLFTDEETPAARSVSASRKPEGKGSKKRTKTQKILTAVSARRPADLSARFKSTNPYMRRLNYLLPVSLLSAILAGGIAVALGGNVFGDGLTAFTATYLGSLPAAYLFAMTLPLWQANRLLHEKGTTVVGEASPVFYAKRPSRLVFSDGEAIQPLHRKEITLRSDGDPEHWRRLADLTFRLMDSPMKNQDETSREDGNGHRLEVAEQGEGYARFYLADDATQTAVEVLMGTHDALVRKGIRLPKINMEERYKKSRDSHVIYLAFDRRFHLAYAVEYRVSNRFLRASRELTAAGHSVSICAYDPFVRKDNPGLTRFFESEPVALVTPTAVEQKRNTRAGGLLATGRSLDLLYPFTACRRICSTYRLAQLIAWLNIPVTLGITVLLCALGLGGILTAAAVTLWQMLLVGGVILLDLLTVNRDRLGLSPHPTTPPAPQQENHTDSD